MSRIYLQCLHLELSSFHYKVYEQIDKYIKKNIKTINGKSNYVGREDALKAHSDLREMLNEERNKVGLRRI